MAKPNKTSSAEFEKEAEHAAQQERAIQRKIDKSDKQRGHERQSGAMQAGARFYPVPPLPDQHLLKPGTEADLELAPMYDAPHYKGSEKLLGQGRANNRWGLWDWPVGCGLLCS